MKFHETAIQPILVESAGCRARNRVRIDKTPKVNICLDWLKPRKDFSVFETLNLPQRYEFLTPEDNF